MRLMHPPATGNHAHQANGRTYSAAAGSPVSVADQDAAALEANGWTASGDGTGTTAQRPSASVLWKGFHYNDTTVGAMVVWDGKAWRHATTGSAA